MLLFEEKDELYSIGVDVTRDQRFVILTSESSETTEQQLLPADKPDDKFVVYQKRNLKYVKWSRQKVSGVILEATMKSSQCLSMRF